MKGENIMDNYSFWIFNLLATVFAVMALYKLRSTVLGAGNALMAESGSSNLIKLTKETSNGVEVKEKVK